MRSCAAPPPSASCPFPRPGDGLDYAAMTQPRSWCDGHRRVRTACASGALKQPRDELGLTRHDRCPRSAPAPAGICRGNFPDGRQPRRRRHLLGRAAPARHPPARRLPLLAFAQAPAALGSLHRHPRHRLRRGRPRLRRPRRDVDQRRHRAGDAQPPRRGPRPFDRMLARTASSSAGFTGSSSAAPFSANRCSAAAPTPRRSRWPGSSRGSSVGHFTLLDCQFITDHLASLGATQLSRSTYVALLGAALGSGAAGASLLGGVSLGRVGRGRAARATRCRRPTSARSTGCSRPRAWPARRARPAS